MIFREHFAVPEGLDIRLVDYRAWKWMPWKGVCFHTLWFSHGRYYMCDHAITGLDALPFWDTTRMSDLIECDIITYFQKVRDADG